MYMYIVLHMFKYSSTYMYYVYTIRVVLIKFSKDERDLRLCYILYTTSKERLKSRMWYSTIHPLVSENPDVCKVYKYLKMLSID